MIKYVMNVEDYSVMANVLHISVEIYTVYDITVSIAGHQFILLLVPRITDASSRRMETAHGQ